MVQKKAVKKVAKKVVKTNTTRCYLKIKTGLFLRDLRIKTGL